MSVDWRAWRLVVDSTLQPYLLVEYFAVTATLGGASIFTGGTASASTEYSAGFLAANAFDDNSTAWACSSGGLPAHVQYDRGAGNSTTGRFLYMRGYSVGHSYSPRSITLQGSADGSTGWTDLLDVDITGYALTDRWVIDSNGTVCIPFGHIVSGNSTHSDTTDVQRVFISDWTTGELVDKVIPDSAGDWESVIVGTADVLIVGVGDSGYKPIADGPVTPAAR